MIQRQNRELPAPTAEEIQEWLEPPSNQVLQRTSWGQGEEMQAAWADGSIRIPRRVQWQKLRLPFACCRTCPR